MNIVEQILLYAKAYLQELLIALCLPLQDYFNSLYNCNNIPNCLFASTS